jgi:hypothetical protein
MTGATVNHYRITARISAGGMGEAFRARRPRLSRDMAVTIVPKDLPTANGLSRSRKGQ